MAKLTFDFRNAPPSNGSSVDRVPEGKYRFTVTKMESSNTQKGKPMVTASYKVAGGAERNKRLQDRFVLPGAKGDSMFGLQRMHAFLLASGVAVGANKVELDINKLVGKSFEATVRDNEQPESPKPGGGVYPARTTSQIDEYLFQEDKATPKPESSDEDEADSDDEEEEAPKSTKKTAPVVDVDDDDDDNDAEDEDDEEEEPAPPPLKKTSKAKKPPVDDDEDEDPDLLFA